MPLAASPAWRSAWSRACCSRLAAVRRRVAGSPLEARRAADVARDVADRAEVTAEVLGERVDHYLGREQEVAWRKVREIREGVDRYTQAQAL